MGTELNMDLAREAYRNISHVPEQRAEGVRREMDAHLAALATELEREAQTDEQRAQASVELERYREEYVKRLHTVLAARARTASPLVTGGARFPVASNRKRLATEDRKADDFVRWQGRARRRAIIAVRDAGMVPEVSTGNGPAVERIAELPGLVAERNHMLDRLQLFFDGKPSEWVRDRLKGSGWHWSPKSGAWQRKITPNAEANLEDFINCWKEGKR